MNINRRRFLQGMAALVGSGLAVKYGLVASRPLLQKLDDAINDGIRDLPAASISAAIIRERSIYWQRNVGFHDISCGKRMHADSAWQSIGSISKLIVWTAVMQLVEQGQITLEEDISHYLGFPLRSPFFPGTAISTEHLLTHSSGLSSRRLMSQPASMAHSFCNGSSTRLADWIRDSLHPETRAYTPAQLFDRYQPGQFSMIPPDPLGVANGYSNINAVVAAYIVEQVTGMDFKQYCEQKIFTPCGMYQTAWHKAEHIDWLTHYESSQHIAPVMQPFTQAMIEAGFASTDEIKSASGNRFRDFTNCDYQSSAYPMGLLGTSLRSFLPFMLAFLNQGRVNDYQLLLPDTVAKMLRYRRTVNHHGSQLGLGWFRFFDDHGRPAWGHDGGGPGIVSTAQINPDSGNGIVLFINNFHIDHGLKAELVQLMWQVARQQA